MRSVRKGYPQRSNRLDESRDLPLLRQILRSEFVMHLASSLGRVAGAQAATESRTIGGNVGNRLAVHRASRCEVFWGSLICPDIVQTWLEMC